MAGSTPSCQPRVSVADDTFAPSLPKKVLGAAFGVVVTGLVLAPSPAQALTSCASVSSPLGMGDSCTITDGADTYEISLTTIDTFQNAFPTPSDYTSDMFWWGDQTKATSAAQAVGAAWNFRLGLGGATGPIFAFQYTPPITTRISYFNISTGQTGDAQDFGGSYPWARSSLVPSGGTSSVPGPLSILGLAAAFGFSRKLRKRIKLHKGTSAVSTSPGA